MSKRLMRKKKEEKTNLKINEKQCLWIKNLIPALCTPSQSLRVKESEYEIELEDFEEQKSIGENMVREKVLRKHIWLLPR